MVNTSRHEAMGGGGRGGGGRGGGCARGGGAWTTWQLASQEPTFGGSHCSGSWRMPSPHAGSGAAQNVASVLFHAGCASTPVLRSTSRSVFMHGLYATARRANM